MIIIGIDPGLADTGYGVIKAEKDHFIYLAHGVIKTAAAWRFPDRLLRLHQELKKIFLKYRPQKCAVEKLFFYKNTKTAGIVGEARGVIILTACWAKIPVFEFTPLEVKQALTTYGRAEKSQVQKMVQKVLSLPSLPKPDDAADALAIAVCCAQTRVLGG